MAEIFDVELPDDLDFEHYTYVVGRADVYSPYYYVSQDTLVYEDGCFTYTLDYFYSPSDSCSDAANMAIAIGRS